MEIEEKISDEKMVELLIQSVERENRQLAQTLLLLSEVMDRRIHLALGFASLFEFCLAKLCFSEGAVYRRTQVAAKIKAYPLLYRSIKESKINLTVASAICPHLATSTCPDEFIRRFFGKTKRQAEEMLIETKGAVPVPKAKDLLSHTVPDGALERVFEAALDQFLKANDSLPRTQTNSPKSSEGRYIPRAMSFDVRKRSGDRCEFIGATGRCLATKFLVIDHIRPLSKAGKTETDNLQILCTAHNHFKAEIDHGRGFIAAKISQRSGQQRGRKTSMIGKRI